MPYIVESFVMDCKEQASDARNIHEKGMTEKTACNELKKVTYNHDNIGEFNKSSTDGNLASSFDYIKKICRKMNIPKEVRDNSISQFKAVHNKQKLKGLNVEATMAAIIYAECRRSKMPRAVREFRASTNIQKNTISRICRIISKFLSSPAKDKEDETDEQVIRRCCSELKLPTSVASRAAAFNAKIVELGLICGCRPATIQSVAIYLAAEDGPCPKLARAIGMVTGVSGRVIKTRADVLSTHVWTLLN